MQKSFAHWKADFFTGLAVVLPAVISIGVEGGVRRVKGQKS